MSKLFARFALLKICKAIRLGGDAISKDICLARRQFALQKILKANRLAQEFPR